MANVKVVHQLRAFLKIKIDIFWVIYNLYENWNSITGGCACPDCWKEVDGSSVRRDLHHKCNPKKIKIYKLNTIVFIKLIIYELYGHHRDHSARVKGWKTIFMSYSYFYRPHFKFIRLSMHLASQGSSRVLYHWRSSMHLAVWAVGKFLALKCAMQHGPCTRRV